MNSSEFKKIILEKAKAKGLIVAENAAGDLQELAFEIVDEVVKLTANKYDDMVWTAVRGKADEMLKGLVDKIDGQVSK